MRPWPLSAGRFRLKIFGTVWLCRRRVNLSICRRRQTRAPGPFAFAEPDYVTSILQEAGFSEVKLEPHRQELQLFSGQQVREAAENFARINPIISAFVKEAGDAGAEPLFAKLAAALEPFHKNQALHFPSATWMVSARA